MKRGAFVGKYKAVSYRMFTQEDNLNRLKV